MTILLICLKPNPKHPRKLLSTLSLSIFYKINTLKADIPLKSLIYGYLLKINLFVYLPGTYHVRLFVGLRKIIHVPYAFLVAFIYGLLGILNFIKIILGLLSLFKSLILLL